MAKIGDKVVFKRNYNLNSDCIVSDVAFHADHGVTYFYFDGETRESSNGWDEDSFDVVGNELEELRAFKAVALARFPALAKPETDDEAAERFRDEFYDAGGMTLAQGFKDAFAWARANPR